MRAFPMDAQAYVGVGAPIRADYYVVSPHNIREPSGLALQSAGLEGLLCIRALQGPIILFFIKYRTPCPPFGGQGVRIPCIVLAVSSVNSNRPQGRIVIYSETGGLQGPLCQKSIFAVQPGGCAPRPPFTLIIRRLASLY